MLRCFLESICIVDLLSSAVDLAVYCFSVLRSSLSLSVFDVGVVGYIGVLWWAVLRSFWGCLM